MLLSLLLWVTAATAATRELTEREYSALDKQYFKKKNDKRVRPKNGEILDVDVDFLIVSIAKVSHAEMNYELSLFFRQGWVDDKLMKALRSVTKNKNDTILLDPATEKNMWKPDLLFKQEETARRHTVLAAQKMIEVTPEGIMMSEHITLKLRCVFHLKLFPFDTQTCSFIIRPYSFDQNQIRVRWANRNYADGEKFKPIKIDSEAEIPGFVFQTSIDPANCTTASVDGTYSCIRGNFQFQRYYQHYLFQIYLPSTLCVIVSWISFWLNLQAAPARITLGITTLLNIVSMNYNINRSFPAVSYMKAVDYWNCSCFLFVVSSLVEFGIATIKLRIEQKHSETAQKVMNTKGVKHWGGVNKKLTKSVEERGKVIGGSTGLLIDKKSRYGFPIAFVIFNLIYWLSVVTAVNLPTHEYEVIEEIFN